MLALIIAVCRLPLEICYWIADFVRVTYFAFSANEKVTRRCPFGCYDEGSVVQDGLRKCPRALKYRNFWLFRTLCKCAQKPSSPIPGIAAICRDRGSFEITFSRWASIVLTVAAGMGACVFVISAEIKNRYLNEFLKDANPTTLRVISQIGKQEPKERAPTVLRPTEARPEPPQLTDTEVAKTEANLLRSFSRTFADPANPGTILRVARGLVATGDTAEGRRILSELRTADPKFTPAAAVEMLYAIQAGAPNQATQIASGFAEAESPDPWIAAASTVAAVAAGNLDQAKQLAAHLDGVSDDAVPVAGLARAFIASGGVTAAQLAAQADLHPDLSDLIRQRLSVGDAAAVTDRCRQLAAMATAPSRLRAAAASYLWNEGHTNAAAAAAAAIVRQRPDVADAQFIQAAVFLRGGAPDLAAERAQSALGLIGRSQQTLPLMRLLAQALQAADRPDAARQAWLDVRTVAPEDPEATQALRTVPQHGQP